MAALLNALKKKKTPAQLVASAMQVLPDVFETSADSDAAKAKLAKRFGQMKAILYGEENAEPNQTKCEDLARALVEGDALIQMVNQVTSLPFEMRKDLSKVFTALLHRDIGGFSNYMVNQQECVHKLVNMYRSPEMALIGGQMLREIVRQPILHRMILDLGLIWDFFGEFVHSTSFDVASDAFATLRDLLTKNKEISSPFLDSNYDRFCEAYLLLLDSTNYVIRRQSLNLLGEILLERSNYQVLIRFIVDKNHLKKIMLLMRDTSQTIQFEAFHVFKIFVANPRKSEPIISILLTNKDKLMTFLENFHPDKEDDHFNDEKQLLIDTLAALLPPNSPEPNPENLNT